MKEYGMRKFVPGQIIFATINTSALNGDITKNRPYLIIASNNRRIVVLKMTHNGEYSSNWIYSLEDIDGQTSNIICDCPITVNVSTIIENYTHDKFLTPEPFKDVFKKNRNRVVYMNNKYNVTLKSGLIVNKTKTSSNAKEYAREIITDCENVGFEKAGLIWGRGTEFMRKNYWKFKEE